MDACQNGYRPDQPDGKQEYVWETVVSFFCSFDYNLRDIQITMTNTTNKPMSKSQCPISKTQLIMSKHLEIVFFGYWLLDIGSIGN